MHTNIEIIKNTLILLTMPSLTNSRFAPKTCPVRYSLCWAIEALVVVPRPGVFLFDHNGICRAMRRFRILLFSCQDRCSTLDHACEARNLPTAVTACWHAGTSVKP